jgi:hypothetical protein
VNKRKKFLLDWNGIWINFSCCFFFNPISIHALHLFLFRLLLLLQQNFLFKLRH